jgi:hypothetical protein
MKSGAHTSHNVACLATFRAREFGHHPIEDADSSSEGRPHVRLIPAGSTDQGIDGSGLQRPTLPPLLGATIPVSPLQIPAPLASVWWTMSAISVARTATRCSLFLAAREPAKVSMILAREPDAPPVPAALLPAPGVRRRRRGNVHRRREFLEPLDKKRNNVPARANLWRSVERRADEAESARDRCCVQAVIGTVRPNRRFASARPVRSRAVAIVTLRDTL